MATAIQSQPCVSTDNRCLCAHSAAVQSAALPCVQRSCSVTDIQSKTTDKRECTKSADQSKKRLSISISICVTGMATCPIRTHRAFACAKPAIHDTSPADYWAQPRVSSQPGLVLGNSHHHDDEHECTGRGCFGSYSHSNTLIEFLGPLGRCQSWAGHRHHSHSRSALRCSLLPCQATQKAHIPRRCGPDHR